MALPVRGDNASGRPIPRRRRPELGPMGPMALVFIVTASGVAAALGPGHPTGIGPFDIVLKAALGVTCALAASMSPWPALACGAVIVAVGSARQPTFLPAWVALIGSFVGCWRRYGRGGAAADADTDGEVGAGRRTATKPLPAAAGALVCQVALRLTWPHVALVPSAIGTAAVLAVMVPGIVRAPHRVKVWATATAAVLVVAAIALTALAGVAMLSARSSIEHGLRVTAAGGKAAAVGNASLATKDFTEAKAAFATAGGDVRLAGPDEVVPVLSQQVRAVRTAVKIGQQVSAVALQNSTSVDMQALKLKNGTVPLQAIERLGPLFAADLRSVKTALTETEAFRSPWVVPPLKARLDEALPKLAHAQLDADDALAAVKTLPGMMGADGARRYLVLFVNPAESRASGGVVGNYAVVSAVDGKLSLGKLGSVSQLDSSGSPATRKLKGPADYIARYSQFDPQDLWQNVPMSPDFPSVGEVAANLFPESGGDPVNGVISIDPAAMAGLLKVTGPITNPYWPRPLGSSDVVQVLASTEFVHFADTGTRQSFLDDLIREMWHALVSRPLPTLPTMAKDLAQTFEGRHLMMYSTTAAGEQLLRDFDIAGQMPKVHGDFLDVVTQNFGGNKLDWYLRRSITYQASLDRSTGVISSVVTMKLHNGSPKSGLPTIVLGPSPGGNTTPGENELYVSIYSPWLEYGAWLNGVPTGVTSQEELGRYVYSAIVTIPPGGQVTLTMRLSGRWPNGSEPYHLTIYHQPQLFPDKVVTSHRVIG